MPDPLIGRKLGKYQIQQEIGRGGMARVYRAVDTVLQRPVALKVLAPSLSADPEFARRFEREAITAANLRHPAIVTIFDVGEADGLRYIAMEYIAGRTLNEVLEEHGRLGIPLTIALIAPVADALDFAHTNGMVHRDVKPHNIMLDTDGRVLLTDFGIAIDPAEGNERLTRTGMFMGTPEYISPEQAQAQPLGGRSDIYSLGIVTYEMLAGRVPFEGGTPQQIMAHVYQTPPPLTSLDRTSPPELDQIFAKVLAKDPAARFERAGGLIEALRYVARRYGLPPATRDDVAALAMSRGSSAGQATVAMRTPAGVPVAPPVRPNPTQTPAPFPIADVFGQPQANGQQRPSGPSATQNRATPMQTPPSGMPVPPPRRTTGGTGGQHTGQRTGANQGYSYGGNDQFVPPPRVPPRRSYNDDGGSNIPWALLALGAIGVVAIMLVVLLTRGTGDVSMNLRPTPGLNPFDQRTPTIAPTLTPRPSATSVTQPTPVPEGTPTPEVVPTATVEPTGEPTQSPTTEPTIEPTTEPTQLPTAEPTAEPTQPPTDEPTVAPTDVPTAEPTQPPTTTPLPLPTATEVIAGVPTPVGGGGRVAYFSGGALNVRDVPSQGVETFSFDLEPLGPPAVSPDGATVLLDVREAKGNTRQIAVLNRQNGQITLLTQGQGDNFHPSWRPDGGAIVFASTRNGTADLYIMQPDGSQPEQLTSGSGDDQYPSFAPDGTRILFESTREGPQWNVYTIDAAGGLATPLTSNGRLANNRSPRWSPDGTEIVFVSDRDRADAGFEVYAQSVESNEGQRLTTFSTGSTDGPTWSPDGTLIAFFGNRAGSDDIYVLDRLNDLFLPSPASAPDTDERWPTWSK